jgi:hypothetical protein
VAVALATVGLATLALRPPAIPWSALALAAWIWLLAAVLEPSVPGAAAALARPRQAWVVELRGRLSGGMTTPGGAVHLWAPALTVAAAVLFALPFDLWLVAREVSGTPNALAGAIVLALPLALAVGLRVVAGRAFARGVWPAVAELAEADRTLAGPPRPERAPRWLVLRDPLHRVVALELLRGSPLPLLRLSLLGACATSFVSGEVSATASTLVVALACAALWVLPNAGCLRRLAPARDRFFAALPLRRGPASFTRAVAALPVAFVLGAWIVGALVFGEPPA